MMEILQQYWWAILIAVAVVVLLAFLLRGGGKPGELEDGPTTAKDPADVPTYVSQSPTGLGGPVPPEEPQAATTVDKPAIPAAVGDPDDLMRIKGIGPKLNMLLTELGIIRYDQIAAFSDDDLAEIDDHLGNFKGRPARDKWVDQASYLAQDDIAGYEAKYGKL